MKYKIFLLKRFISTLFLPYENTSKWVKWSKEDSINSFYHNQNSDSQEYLGKLMSKYEFNTLLEIGGNCGGRLFNLAQSNPSSQFICTDVSPNALDAGEEIKSQKKISNIEYRILDVQNNKQTEILFKQYKPEIIFSWATLIYVHPIFINRVIRNIVDSECKYFILIEQDSKNLNKLFYRGLLTKLGPNWLRNYEFLVKKAIKRKKNLNFSVERIECPSNIWNPGGGNAKTLVFRFTRH